VDAAASSFTLRKNAKRAAEAMIRKGIAPAVDYRIRPGDDGRFEIVWKTAKTGRPLRKSKPRLLKLQRTSLQLCRRPKSRHKRQRPQARDD
jgi:hypothetical protein